MDEAFGVGAEGGGQGGLAGGVDLAGFSEMDLVGRHQAEAGMVMVLVVPAKEGAKKGDGVFDATEAFWKLRLVFQCLELAFRIRIVVGDIGPRVGFGDAKVGQQ